MVTIGYRIAPILAECAGADPHTSHVHVSLLVPYASTRPSNAECLRAENSAKPWLAATLFIDNGVTDYNRSRVYSKNNHI